MSVLGACGQTGRALVRRILSDTDWIVVAGARRSRQLAALKEWCSRDARPDRVVAKEVDVENTRAIQRAVEDCNAVVVAASAPKYLVRVASAAMEVGCNYVDLWYSPKISSDLSDLALRMTHSGRLLVSQAGACPGIPAALLRLLATEVEVPTDATAAISVRSDWRCGKLAASTHEEVSEPPQRLVYSMKRWHATPNSTVVDFGPTFGTEYCRPLYLEEVDGVCKMLPCVRNAAMFVSVDYNRSRPAPHGSMIVAEVKNVERGMGAGISVFHPDGYELTAASVMAVLKQALERGGKGPQTAGLWIDPTSLLAELERSGADVYRKPFRSV